MINASFLAYIDPMSGALLLQILMAAVIGCLAFFRRTLWGLVTAIFRIGASTAKATDTSENRTAQEKRS